MKGQIKDRFNPSAVHHIYQRSKDKGVIFYSLEDRLVYYTLLASKARRRGVRVVALSVMFTHIHQSLIVGSLKELRNYLHDVDTSMSKIYNNRYHRSGRLFEKPPGRSMKTSPKAIRSNLIYVFNNHTEKKICSQATEERWAFLAYAFSDYPFSERIDREKAERKPGKSLWKSLNLVDRRVRKKQNLDYGDLDRILPKLDAIEKEQFIDYVISSYALVDFSFSTSHFGSLESFVIAVNSSAGGEYDIKEDYTSDSDVAYCQLLNYTDAVDKVRDIYTMPVSSRGDLALDALRHTTASLYQLRKFFHL